MSNINIFEAASRQSIRFNSNSGLLSVEQLWDLPLTSASKVNLNDIAKDVSRDLKALGEESFVSTENNSQSKLRAQYELKLEIVKRIITVRQEENAAKLDENARREKARLVDQLILQKKNEALAGLSLEELEKMKNTL